MKCEHWDLFECDCPYFVTMILGALSLIPLLMIISVGDNSEGIRSCVPVKLSEKGWIWKTWEGECVLSGLTSQGANVWRFSICGGNGEQVEQVQQMIRDQKTGTFGYKSPLIYGRWEMKSGYCISEIG